MNYISKWVNLNIGQNTGKYDFSYIINTLFKQAFFSISLNSIAFIC